MTFGVGMVFGALVFSLLYSLVSNIRDARPGKTVYEVWLEDVAKDNVIPMRRDFSKTA
ncbi:hypothetical protein [Boseongicola aestuarii]|jgi:hypothetical protein|uniref:Uncharacterized protein n=1 Tax=Boseongicola aestuarii TaxID=1470561 RepID=A0A238J3M2_9RHOB|nr:hypothetical protein [Boseongicola aestuarii]SMX24765.1 hypothetical protein BOA8489_02894 [Boseongicola aestuarii]